MLDKTTAQDVLFEAISLGADFCDIFVERHQSKNIQVLSSKVHEIKSGIDFGIGVRLIYGTKVLYGYTNSIEKEELIRITRLLAASEKRNAVQETTVLNFSKINDIHPATQGINNDIPNQNKIDFLMSIDQAARAHHEKVEQVRLGAGQRLQDVEIFNSEGLHTKDTRHYTRLFSMVMAAHEGEQATGYEAPGALTGWEMSQTIDPKQLGEMVAKQAITKLFADPCPSGKMPVVLDNGFGGVIFHEACGHLLETTSVQKKASVFWDKMGETIANPCVSAVDDGTMENYWGSINIDDEGMPTQKTQLIKDGVLTGFLVDKVGNLKTGHPRSGSGRKESYKYAPASRMRNTFIEPGKDSFDDMIASIDHGVYCKKMGGGSVQPGTGEFNFAANESYLIKNGKIDKPLKSATLIGTGPEVLKEISMISSNLELAAGMCGSVSGSVPTTVGQAALKIDNILVGGQANG
ncbi:MAG: TldD/PmbA family protein [Bdellovibrionota bacterium]|nr:TldD/PmbA family protein [Bdellovibrionota bacterium]